MVWVLFEGEQVRQGQLPASIDPAPYQMQLDRAQSQLAGDQALLTDARRAQDAILIAQLEGRARTDRANIDNAKLQLVYTEIRSPITGVAGLRMVDPGNIVHAADSTGIVIISQLQPIAILFTLFCLRYAHFSDSPRAYRSRRGIATTR